MTCGGLPVGNDGILWHVFPDNSVQDLTITAQARHYDASANPKKYRPFIVTNGYFLLPDRIVRAATNYWVGQRIDLSTIFSPDLVEASSKETDWLLPPSECVNKPAVFGDPANSCTIYIYDVLLAADHDDMTIWWVGHDGEVEWPVMMHCDLRLSFSNGQKVYFPNLEGKVLMHRPAVAALNRCQDLGNPNPRIPDPCLYVTNYASGFGLGNSWGGGYARFWVSG